MARTNASSKYRILALLDIRDCFDLIKKDLLLLFRPLILDGADRGGIRSLERI